MCGICGVVQVDGPPRAVVPQAILDRMTDAMTHRGPNDRGTYVAPGVAFGVRRLSIIDVEGGHQPFSNEDGTIWAIQNGELYNHADLRRELEGSGHRFASVCDTEVIPHLYEHAGTAFAERLRGKFGLAVWDERRQRATVVRDRLGVKPLYYARTGDVVVFASELKSLLTSGLVEPEIDARAVDALLTFGFIPGPLSPIVGVSKLMPGHRLVIEPGIVRTEAYWRYPRPAPGPAGLGIDHYADGVMASLEEAVRLRLMSDVPVGAMLSGGLDSSLVVALMARHTTQPVKTFSIGFAEAGDGNELADAREIASIFGTEHHELELSFSEQSVDLAELVWFLDEPLADLSALGFLALSELAATSVTVALSGQGADELYGGYLKHKAAALAGRWDRLPGGIRRAGAALAPHARGRMKRSASTLLASDPAARLMAMSSKLDPALRRELVRGPLAALDEDPAFAAVRAALGDVEATALATTLYLDGQLALVDDMLHYFDRASMAHSLEVRVPFLDHAVVEHAATIPDRFKVNGLTTKKVLKHAAKDILPDRIINKRKLGFFREEVDAWFRAQLSGPASDYLLGVSPKYEEFLDRRVVERLVRSHATGDDAHSHLLLAILMLEVWLSTFLPRIRDTDVSTRDVVRIAS
jgi:asparagine synthase (glutamine-hydrolysing)